MKSLGNLARVGVLLGACLAAAGSASSSSQSGMYTPQQQQGAAQGPPSPTAMDPSASLGLWKSTFGAVKIEADNSKGGLQSGAVQGVWVYQRQGQEVVGYFAGALRGNVLDFRWQEPANPPLTGEGYLVFDTQGQQYAGKWWSAQRDRTGEWNGWRQSPVSADPNAAQPSPYGGDAYGAYPPPNPY